MLNIQYKKACVEVLQILKYISKEDYEKIPNNFIKIFEKEKEENYNFEYNPKKTLNEQNVLKETKIIIALFFRDYWSNNYQRKVIFEKEKENQKKNEESKKEKYKYNEIFKKKKIDTNYSTSMEKSLVKIKEQTWYEKIYIFIRNFFI